jgi:hypothetical protein
VALPVGWLGSLTRGLALETFAPQRIFGLRRAGWVRSMHGRLEVRPLEPTTSLGALPLAAARPAIVIALNRFARVLAYERWLLTREAKILQDATCAGDELPQTGPVSPDELLP